MDEYYRLKTTRTKPRAPNAPQRQEKRKQWERNSNKRSMRDES